jgi:hypothetical protein
MALFVLLLLLPFPPHLNVFTTIAVIDRAFNHLHCYVSSCVTLALLRLLYDSVMNERLIVGDEAPQSVNNLAAKAQRPQGYRAH